MYDAVELERLIALLSSRAAPPSAKIQRLWHHAKKSRRWSCLPETATRRLGNLMTARRRPPPLLGRSAYLLHKNPHNRWIRLSQALMFYGVAADSCPPLPRNSSTIRKMIAPFRNEIRNGARPKRPSQENLSKHAILTYRR